MLFQRPGLNSQYPRDSQPSVTLIPGGHTHTCKRNTHPHKINKSLKKKCLLYQSSTNSSHTVIKEGAGTYFFFVLFHILNKTVHQEKIFNIFWFPHTGKLIASFLVRQLRRKIVQELDLGPTTREGRTEEQGFLSSTPQVACCHYSDNPAASFPMVSMNFCQQTVLVMNKPNETLFIMRYSSALKIALLHISKIENLPPINSRGV